MYIKPYAVHTSGPLFSPSRCPTEKKSHDRSVATVYLRIILYLRATLYLCDTHYIIILYLFIVCVCVRTRPSSRQCVTHPTTIPTRFRIIYVGNLYTRILYIRYVYYKSVAQVSREAEDDDDDDDGLFGVLDNILILLLNVYLYPRDLVARKRSQSQVRIKNSPWEKASTSPVRETIREDGRDERLARDTI